MPRAPRLASGGAIREAAGELFLEKGYDGTSMDEVAARAGVSKQTIYTHFASKEAIFEDLVLGNADRVAAFGQVVDQALAGEGDVEERLAALARRYAAFVIRPEVLRLRRLVLGEAGRFPELARRYYEAVPQRTYAELARGFEGLARAGELRLADPLRAAHHFAWLVLGWPMDVGLFEPERLPGPKELDRLAGEAARVFVRAYR